MSYIDNFCERVLELLAYNNLQLFLLAGSGVLAISFLVLALTRWGQARPVWKCVILSFAAHILLIGYAYGTRLMFEPAVPVADTNVMRVNLTDDPGQSLDGVPESDESDKAWDQFVSESPLPEVADLARPLVDSEVVIEKPSVEPGEPAGDVRSFAALKELPLSPVQIEEPRLSEPKPSSVLESAIADAVLEPERIDIERRGEASDPVPHPQFKPLDELARQDLVNAKNSAETDPFSVEPQDQPDPPPFVSELLDSKADVPFSAELLPAPAAAPQLESVKPLRLQKVNTGQLRVTGKPRRIGDGQPLPELYALRSAADRMPVSKRRGGSVATEQAVAEGLKWLAEHQSEDGSWNPRLTGGGVERKVFGHDRDGAGANADSGITALATLAFLGAGHSHLEGDYQTEVQKGLEYLVRQQKISGDLSGDAKLFAQMYCHSMSLLALSEALALTGDQRLLPPVQLGVDYSVKAQNQRDGGWRYQPGDSGDMSQFGWQVLALHSAGLGGAKVPPHTIAKMREFLESCAAGVSGGLASYRPRQQPSTTMTAESFISRMFLDQGITEAARSEALRRVSRELPAIDQVNYYYWYYGTLAMYHSGGPEWEQWNEQLKSTLLQLQTQSGSDKGSWPANGLWGGYGGRVYSTAMATLNLEVYYRYLPMHESSAGTEMQARSEDDFGLRR